jgi:hypothetical protein
VVVGATVVDDVVVAAVVDGALVVDVAAVVLVGAAVVVGAADDVVVTAVVVVIADVDDEEVPELHATTNTIAPLRMIGVVLTLQYVLRAERVCRVLRPLSRRELPIQSRSTLALDRLPLRGCPVSSSGSGGSVSCSNRCTS